MSVFITFSVLTVLIAILGLTGLVIYNMEQRTKEVGVRKSMGASVNQIVFMFSKDYTRWIAVGFLIACPLAYLSINNWLDNFAYKTEIGWWVFLLAGSLAFIIAGFTISFQAIKAAMANPVESLRYE